MEFTFKESGKGWNLSESLALVVLCTGNERWLKWKNMEKCRSKGHSCYNCGGLDYHAKECKLPPQAKKRNFCQNISHMVASCPLKSQWTSSSQESKLTFLKKRRRSISLCCSQRPKIELRGWRLSFCDQKVLKSRYQQTDWRKWGQGDQGAASIAIYLRTESTTSPSLPFCQGRGYSEANESQPCSIQMHVRVLGENPFLHALSESTPESPDFESGLDTEIVCLLKNI